MIDFVKMHGAGNDFIVVEDLGNHIEIDAADVVRWCDRHRGIGADGLIRIGTDARGAHFMDYRNADGSIAEICGNGTRVVGKYLGDRSVEGDDLLLATRAGDKRLTLHRERGARASVGSDRPEGRPVAERLGPVVAVSADMGPPTEGDRRTSLEVDGQVLDITVVHMPNPHAVIFVEDVDAVDLAHLGPRIEHHEQFPQRTNVEIVAQVGPSTFRQRTWERGCGETLACGSGACGVAVAIARRGLASGAVTIELRGGALHLDWDPRSASGVVMTGPAVEVFTGMVHHGSPSSTMT